MSRILVVLMILTLFSGCRMFSDPSEVELESACSTCATVEAQCGSITNSCGDVLDCGVCDESLFCGGGQANMCSATPCEPETDATFCSRLGKNCEIVNAFDNCGQGRGVNCGECDEGKECGGKVANVCPCRSLPPAEFCKLNDGLCGRFTGLDACGLMRTEDCPNRCETDECEDNKCVGTCTEPTDYCEQHQLECGQTSATCGTLNCGDCNEGVCTDNLCCMPLTCEDANGLCTINDGCDGTLECPRNCGTAMSIGDRFMCSVNDTGDVHCWGTNADSQLGQPGGGTSTPRQVNGLTGVTHVAAGATGVLYATANNLLYAGSLNDNYPFRSPIPMLVSWLAMPPITQIDHWTHSCALDVTGRLYCWGANDFGQAGLTPSILVSQPTNVFGDVKHFSVGFDHTCAVNNGGALYCWGNNTYGQASKEFNNRLVPNPTLYPLAFPVAKVEAGREFTCVLSEADEVWCTGRNQYEQLGGASDTNPVQVPGVVREFGVGSGHACAINQTGALYCWGNNKNGLIETSGTATFGQPTLIDLPRKAVRLRVGFDNICVRLEDGGLWCRGLNEDGQLGQRFESSSGGDSGLVEFYP